MEMLEKPVKPLYFKYLIATFGSALVMPVLFGADSLWFAMPIAEISVATVTAILIWHFTGQLDVAAKKKLYNKLYDNAIIG